MATLTAPGLRVHVRWMIRRDLPAMLAIERPDLAAPRTEDDFLRILNAKDAVGMVAEDGERVVGYMIYQLRKRRLGLADLAVAADARRLGVGRQLVARLVVKLNQYRRTRQMIVASAGGANLGAHLFLKAVGFWAYAAAGDEYLFRYVAPDRAGESP